MLHFAYGSNMDRALMRRNCPAARAIGLASLDGYRFIIAACGYASMARAPGSRVHGVLWRLTPRDERSLDRYEAVASRLYDRHMLAVRTTAGRATALTYIVGAHGEGRPRSGYMELVLAAARDWQLPDDHIRELARWMPALDGAQA
jgi:gamma-glutamylcyclotransferase (GGCT)/AIG2-like uncharacterized protein YtfP